jgi:hypothetical protein
LWEQRSICSARPVRGRRGVVAVVAIGALLGACSDDNAGPVGTTLETTISVEPASSGTPQTSTPRGPVGTTLETTISVEPASSGTPQTSAPRAYGRAALVTGGTSSFVLTEGTVTSDADGSSHGRNGTVKYTMTSNDARVSGTVEGSWNSDRWGESAANGAIVQWGTSRLTNDGGSWQAPYSGIYTSETGDIITRWYTGSGGYEGLAFYMWIAGSSVFDWQGLIFPGTPPPLSTSTPTNASGDIQGSYELPTSEDLTSTSQTSPPVSYGPTTLVSGSSSGSAIDEGTVTTDADGSSHSRNGTVSSKLTSNDPRAAGTVAGSWNSDRWGEGVANGAAIEWGTSRLTNNNGSWDTEYSGVYTTETGTFLTRWHTGTGAYEGLAMFSWITESESGEWHGLIFPGVPPTP